MTKTIRVRVLVTHPSPLDEKFKESSWYDILDETPEMENTKQIIDAFRDVPNTVFEVFNDIYVPQKIPERTHWAPSRIQ